MLRLVLGNLGPVQEVLHGQALALDLDLSKASNDVPRKVDRVLLDVGESVCQSKGRARRRSYFLRGAGTGKNPERRIKAMSYR